MEKAAAQAVEDRDKALEDARRVRQSCSCSAVVISSVESQFPPQQHVRLLFIFIYCVPISQKEKHGTKHADTRREVDMFAFYTAPSPQPAPCIIPTCNDSRYPSLDTSAIAKVSAG